MACMVSIARFKAPARMMVLAFATLALTACGGPLVEAGQPTANAGSLPLTATSSLGQSLMAYQGGLQGIEFRLAPAVQRPPGRVTYKLRRRADVADILASGATDVGASTGDTLRIDFPPQSAERLQDFYIELQYAGRDGLSLLTGPAPAYLNGAAYVNGQPAEAQLSFRLLHNPAQAAAGLAGLFGQWLLLSVVAAAILVVPGLALLLALPSDIRPGASRLDLAFLAPALSIASYPLLIVFTGLAGVKAGPAYAWVPILAGGLSLAFKLWRRRASFRKALALRPRLSLEQTALIIVAALVVFSRLWAIRALDAPMWGDSYQHSVLTQLLIERGGLFDDWKPYAEMTSLTYHIGFHSVSAVFAWLTGLSGAQAVLWMGQFLNIAAVLALYPLVRRISGAPWAGVIAVGFAGMVSIHPGYYVNWGRYTQLTGQVALPGVMWLVWTTLARAREPGRTGTPVTLIAISGLAWAGLALAHYRILILGVVFAITIATVGVFKMKSRRWGFAALARGSALGAVLFAPWLARTFAGAIATTGAQLVSTPASQIPEFIASYNSVPDLASILSPWAFALAAAFLVAGLWRRSASIGAILVWVIASFAATNPNALNLPGAGIISNFALLLAAYIPISLVVGEGGGAVVEILGRISMGWVRRAGQAFLAVASFLVIGSGFGQRLTDIEPGRFALLQRPDARAASWIKENTPPDAKFLVNSFAAYGGSLIAGSDGGWWLPLSANRATTQPPFNYSSERQPTPDYVAWVNALPAAIKAEGLSPANMRLLKNRGVSHIYVGQARGATSADNNPLLDPASLLKDDRLKLVYRQDRVIVFAIDFAASGIAER